MNGGNLSVLILSRIHSLVHEFERRSDGTFIFETSMMAKENKLLNLKQGDMLVDSYERKFRTLRYFVVNIDISNENRRCQMFEKEF